MSEDDIAEVFVALGPVTIRRFFSGRGVYVEGVIVALEYGGELRLKADPISAPDFAAAGATQWTYHGHRGERLMPYWSIPPDAFDDPDLMAGWTHRALAAGLRSGVGEMSRTKRNARRR